jgi:bifunctional N-acetylglucosamine-1-phosphate-uridyltransferase/glucosamine-1-phosphate-acetyltransferase GlmU-like protein
LTSEIGGADVDRGGGKGCRLSLASRLPKTLVPVLGVPLIDQVIATYRSVGLAGAIVVVGCEHDLMQLGDDTAARVGALRNQRPL